MVTGAKYYIQIPVLDEPSIINHGPFDTLPKAKEAVERIKKRWGKFTHTTPPGMPSLMIVKVVEEQYVGVEK
jgi:hypothetical protein